MNIQNHHRDKNPDLIESDQDEMLNVEESAIMRGKGLSNSSCKKKKKQETFDNSTHRVPSAFELA